MAKDMSFFGANVRLVKDPELRTLQSGTAVLNMRAAYNTSKKVGDSWEDVGNFLDVIVWGRQAENLARSLKKGSRVAVRGELALREWADQNGNKRMSPELTADFVGYLDPKGDGPTGGGPTQGGGQAQGGQRAAARPATPAAPATPLPAGMDDEIPF